MRCKHCGEEKRVYRKLHYLGVKYVHECACGIKLCTDITGQQWYRYTEKEREEKGICL